MESESERHRQNLQAVLRYAIANSTGEGALDPSKSDQMELDRKQFLENALSSMTIDVIGELEKAIHVLEIESNTVESKVEALNIVRDYAGNIDFANNFIKIGGSKVVLDCLKNRNSKLKICAAYVIAELSQNNPFCQKHFLEVSALQLLMIHTKEDGDVASSSMHAISSLVRNFEQGSAKFIALDGLECVLERLHTRHSNVFVKACFLLRALSIEYPAVRDKFIKLGAVAKLADCVDPVSGFDVKVEIVLNALYVLAQSDEGKVHLKNANIYGVLRDLIDINAGKAECEEILKDSEALLSYIKGDK